MKHRIIRNPCLCVVLLQTGHGGANSALNPAGEDAEKIAELFWWMVGGAFLVWVGVAALAVYAVRARKDIDRERQAKSMILAGAIIPTIVLAVLLTYGLRLLPVVRAPAPEGALRISVKGERWWWRIPSTAPPLQELAEAAERRDAVRAAMASLAYRERRIIQMRFGLGDEQARHVGAVEGRELGTKMLHGPAIPKDVVLKATKEMLGPSS